MITLNKIILLAGIFLAVVYALRCWLNPFKTCRSCRGSGVKISKFLRRSRPCTWCRGRKVRLRWGRKLANWLIKSAAPLLRSPGK